jgi:hypothetical protein
LNRIKVAYEQLVVVVVDRRVSDTCERSPIDREEATVSSIEAHVVAHTPKHLTARQTSVIVKRRLREVTLQVSGWCEFD